MKTLRPWQKFVNFLVKKKAPEVNSGLQTVGALGARGKPRKR